MTSFFMAVLLGRGNFYLDRAAGFAIQCVGTYASGSTHHPIDSLAWALQQIFSEWSRYRSG